MTEQEFWKLIEGAVASKAGSPSDWLINALSVKPGGEIVAFADILARTLFAIDRKELAEQSGWDGTPEAGWSVDRSADAFLYARCAVVLAGRETYAKVRSDPAAFARSWDLGAEALLNVAPIAYEKATGQPWSHKESVSYESGSNPAGWTDEFSVSDEGWRPDMGIGSIADWWLVEASTSLADNVALGEEAQNHPMRIQTVVVGDVSTRLTEVLRSSGGLPAELDLLQVTLELSDGWDLRVRPDGELLDEEDRPGSAFVIQTNGYDEVRWTEAEQDVAILGLVSYVVIVVLRSLSPSHSALPQLERFVADAASLVPFP